MVFIPVPQGPSVAVLTRVPPELARQVRQSTLPWGLGTVGYAMLLTGAEVAWAALSDGGPAAVLFAMIAWFASAMPLGLTGVAVLAGRRYVSREGVVSLTFLRQCRRMLTGMGVLTWIFAPVAILVLLAGSTADDSPVPFVWAALPVPGVLLAGGAFFAGRAWLRDPPLSPQWTQVT